MNKPWFRPLGWTYRPTSWQGFALTAAALAFCVQAFIAIDRHSHSASDTLWGLFPYLASVFLLLNWVAVRKSAA